MPGDAPTPSEPALIADYVRHVMVKTPNWDTKIRCSCGDEFGSRCEFFKHGYEALLAVLNEGSPDAHDA